ncbi:RidA family protein [Rhodoluna lacicola]|jgi:enamine deaminase RidA (YjgF/YER057c/UK114 family)|uniref:Translation initiation inhibitor, yjgF family n=1 Tax=Rhodoluna lacicola TaxID=529884 RepID=A0A060JBE3_9MICO|nr:RidA family protein [Rhodoluna lacicola]AIC47141.1 Putative translation initiation inhibitor, yjgF family [Rhodoluna lacicola]
MSKIEQKLADMGFPLPAVAKPVAAYVPSVVTGNLCFTSGQLPFVDGALPQTGKVGRDVTAEDAKDLARLCALNALAALKLAIGDLDRVTRIVKVVGFVSVVPEFTAIPGVINGASEFLGEVFGEVGSHARSAVGVPALPLDSAVELEIIAEFK